jgi:hypothetical protein
MRFWIWTSLIGITLIAMVFQSGCQWENKKPSFLIITIDSFPFDTVHCNETEKYRGFKTVCDEMVRFTHAYTPSILSQAAVASFLTGKYPFEHGVWNNGSSYLSAKFKTSAEVAYEKGYRTSFVSGGPPIWRKSGFEQGFENFDDHIFVDYGKYYRPVFENLRVMQEWMTNIGRKESFFSFIYLPDLQFPEIPTVDNDGIAREATYDGQLAEVDESLENFFNFLKKENRWDNTWIIVAGLNGISREVRSKDFQGTNLYHENTNVALFVKPPLKQEHQKFSWTVDFNTSLVDVGRTIFDLLDVDFHDTTTTLFQTISLKNALLKSDTIAQDRILLFESGWPQWRRVGRTLFALQKDNYFMLYENPPKLFNTFIDRNQIYPINIHQASMQVLTQTANQLIALLNFDETQSLSQDVTKKYSLARQFFKKNKLNQDVLRDIQLFFSKSKDEEVAGWLARFYIENQRWRDLLTLGTDIQQMDWVWLASTNLNLPSAQPSSCLKLLKNGASDVTSYYNVCNDPILVQFLGWVKNKNKPDAISYRDNFFKTYRSFRADLDVQKLNMQNGFIWDTSKDKILRPQNIELVLALDEMNRFKAIVDKKF